MSSAASSPPSSAALAHRPSASPDVQHRRIALFFAVQVGVLVLGQKLAVPIPGFPISVVQLVTLAGLVLMLCFGRIGLSPTRTALYAAFVIAAIASQLASRAVFSAPSLLLLLVLYIPFLFEWNVDWGFYLKRVDQFLTLMLLAAAIVFAQDAWQLVTSMQSFPSMDRLPSAILLPGYLYTGPITWGAYWMRPNGFFFLESSFVSMFLGIAFILELAFFQRTIRMAVFAAALFACLAGTGLIMVALAAPFLLRRLSPRMLLAAAGLGVIVVVGALASGWLGAMGQRLTEFGQHGSSGNYRVTVPFERLVALSGDPRSLLTGVGAGNIYAEANLVWWPLTKLSVEYGFLTAILFTLFFGACVFGRAPSFALAFSMFMTFNFTGGYQHNPIAVGVIGILLVMMRPIGPMPSIGAAREALAQMRRDQRAAKSAAGAGGRRAAAPPLAVSPR